MTDREKLIELLENANYQCDNRDCDEDAEGCEYRCYPNCWAQLAADHLLANGVVVQRWIPVTERLPDNKEHDWVLVQVVEYNGFRHIPQVMEYRQNKNDWYGETYGWISGHNGAFIVTHWMPLPEPPKEVE